MVPMLMLLALGCKVDQEKEVATYRKVLDANAPATREAVATTQPVLTLAQALVLANQHNERLGIEGENYLQALIDKDRAASAFLPVIALTPSYFAQQRGTNTTGLNAQTHRLDVPVNGQMNVFNGFRDVANSKRAAYTADERRALLLDLQAQILLDVAQTFYQVNRSQRSVVVLENSLQLQTERVRDIESRQRAGLARVLDVAQTLASASSARVSLINAQNDVRNGRATLALLIGSSVGDAQLVDDLALPATFGGPEAFENLAAGKRQDLLAAASATEAAKQGVQEALGQYWPSVAVNANYFLSRESIPTDSDWNAFLSVNIPIFSGGVIHANVRTAYSQLRQARLAENLTRREVMEQTDVAYQNFASSRTRLAELQAQLKASAEASRQAEQSYRVGLATNLERLTAQDQLLSTQLQLASEEYDLKVFYLDLLRAAGDLTPATASSGTHPTTLPSP
jgi:outer membrane protein TolC